MAHKDESTTSQAEARDDDEVLRKRLLKRVAVAGAAVVLLLGGLVLFESMVVRKEPAQQDLARIEPETKPIEKQVEEQQEQAAPEVEQAEEATEKSAGAGVLAKEPEAEPEHTEAPQPEAPPKAARATTRVERPLTVPARAHQAISRPGDATPVAPRPEPAREASTAPIARVAAPQPAPRPLAAAVESVRHFLVQVGVFSNVANAEELRTKIEAAGIPARIEARVQVGPFANRQEAEQAREKLKSLGLDPGLIVAARK